MIRKIALLLIVLFNIVNIKAQNIYNVGNNDGFSYASYAQADNLSRAIYSVGNNDGFSSSSYTQADSPMRQIYSVGNDDGFAYSSSGGVGAEISLPIELLWFKARCDNENIKLNWATASELNNDYFTLERSIDALNFEPIATVNGAGNSSKILKYEFTDKPSTFTPILYYRLKQTDYDGQYEYLKIIAISCQMEEEVSLYPNPTGTGLFTIEGAEQNSLVKVKNVLGQIIHQVKITDVKTKINLSSQASGIYFVEIVSNGIVTLKKIIIDK